MNHRNKRQNKKSFLNILVFIILFGPQSSAQGVAQLLHTGDELCASLETVEALRWYHHAYDIAPKESKTLIRLIRAYGDLGRLHLRKDSSSRSNYLQKVIELPVNSQREGPQRQNAAKFLARLQSDQ